MDRVGTQMIHTLRQDMLEAHTHSANALRQDMMEAHAHNEEILHQMAQMQRGQMQELAAALLPYHPELARPLQPPAPTPAAPPPTSGAEAYTWEFADQAIEEG